MPKIKEGKFMHKILYRMGMALRLRKGTQRSSGDQNCYLKRPKIEAGDGTTSGG